MSWSAIKWALAVSAGGKLPPAAFALLITLADYHNPDHGCFPSQTTLMKRLGMSERHLRNTLRLLEKHKLVKVTCRGRRNGYKLLIAPVAPPNTGTGVPVSDENMIINTGTGVPVHTGTGVPVGPLDTGTGVPLEITSKPEEELTSKWKAEFAAQTSAMIFPETEKTESEEEDLPEDPDAMKIEDVIQTHMAPKTESEVMNIFSAETAKKKTVTGGPLASLWKNLHEVHRPGVWTTAMPVMQQGQLAKAYAMAGKEFPKALAAVIKHWDEFVLYLKLHYDTATAGYPVPNVGLVLKHIQPVMQFYKDLKHAPEAPIAAAVAKPGKLTNVPSSPQSVDLPSKAEALAMIDEALKGA